MAVRWTGRRCNGPKGRVAAEVLGNMSLEGGVRRTVAVEDVQTGVRSIRGHFDPRKEEPPKEDYSPGEARPVGLEERSRAATGFPPIFSNITSFIIPLPIPHGARDLQVCL